MPPPFLGAATVTISATAETAETGTPPRPATVPVTVFPAPTAPALTPKPVRVSSKRADGTEVNGPDDGSPTAAAGGADSTAPAAGPPATTPTDPAVTRNPTTTRAI